MDEMKEEADEDPEELEEMVSLLTYFRCSLFYLCYFSTGGWRSSTCNIAGNVRTGTPIAVVG
jgi:hypothetical protein